MVEYSQYAITLFKSLLVGAILLILPSTVWSVDWSVSSNELIVYETEQARNGSSRNRIFISNPIRSVDSVFFTARGNAANQIKINHRSELMAVFASILGDPESDTKTYWPRNILQIVDSDGTLVSEQDIGVQRFSFSPDGKKIAVISGLSNPGREPAFVPIRIGILDIQTDSITWIRDTSSAPSYEIGYEIAWPNDGHIYISNYKEILKVNEDDFSITTLDIIGSANISPDGKFLYDNGGPYVGSNIRFLDISNNVNVSSSVYALIGDSLDMREYRIHIIWLGDVGSLLLIGLSQMDNADGSLKNTKLTGEHTFLIDVGARNTVFHRAGEKLKAVSYNLNRASSNPFAVQDETGAIKFDNELMQKLSALKVDK